MLDKMKEMGITQKSVAERMSCSQQYILQVLKGSENLRSHFKKYLTFCEMGSSFVSFQNVCYT